MRKSKTDKAKAALKHRHGPVVRAKLTAKRLYAGSSPAAVRFRVGLVAFDLITIGFFVVASFFEPDIWIIVVDAVIGFLLLLDFLARWWLVHEKWIYLLRPVPLADLIVIISLFSVAVMENLGFLRVMRALRLLRSYHILGELMRRHPWFKRNQDVVVSAVNLFVFIFFVTALVYVSQESVNPQINNYMDALYFTVTTLTTTGFGDITMMGSWGKLLAVVIMVLGISLFLRLAQTIFRPSKIYYACPHCGLTRHDPDAVHCKHCGHIVRIPNDGLY